MLDGLELWAATLAASPWILAVVAVFVVIDAFFPPIPSESLIIAVAALAASSEGPNLWLLVAAAAVGAFAGDLLAYTIGARLPIRRIPFLRGRQMQAAFAWADRALLHRPAPFIIAARYIPVGRVAVNMTAGSARYPLRRFLPLSAIAAGTWAAYSTLIGVGAGAWLHGNPFLAVVFGVVGGAAIGLGIDWVLGRTLRVRGAAPDLPAQAAASGPDEVLRSCAAVPAGRSGPAPW